MKKYALLANNRPRRIIQLLFCLAVLYTGWQFFTYIQWATGASTTPVTRPASVEAFLPISAFLAAKRLLLTGQYDTIHPAGLTIFLFAVGTGLLLRRSFCGYMCPLGYATGLLHRLGMRLRLTVRLNAPVSLLLSLPKYFLLAGFAKLILWDMDLASMEAFLQSPYNFVADAKMLRYFTDPSVATLVGLAVFTAGSLVIPGLWCRGFCPYGALLGIFSWLSPIAVARDADACIGCGACTKACPSRIDVQKKLRVTTPECYGCAECVSACPVDTCLSLSAGYGAKTQRLPVWSLALLTVAAFALCYFIAVSTGHWESALPPGMHQRMYQMFLAL